MALSTLTARVDEHDKTEFDQFCNSVGLTASAAINLFVKAALRERKIPFEIKQEDPFYSNSHMKLLEERVTDIKEKRNVHEHELIEV